MTNKTPATAVVTPSVTPKKLEEKFKEFDFEISVDYWEENDYQLVGYDYLHREVYFEKISGKNKGNWRKTEYKVNLAIKDPNKDRQEYYNPKDYAYANTREHYYKNVLYNNGDILEFSDNFDCESTQDFLLKKNTVAEIKAKKDEREESSRKFWFERERELRQRGVIGDDESYYPIEDSFC